MLRTSYLQQKTLQENMKRLRVENKYNDNRNYERLRLFNTV